jgi:hypothetical protein
MKLHEVIEIFRSAGINVVNENDCYFSTSRGITYTFPPVAKYPVQYLNIKRLKWKHFISVIYTDLQIKNTFEFVLSANNYSLELFDKKVRNRIRKSLQHCTFKRPELADLQKEGLYINKKTCKRQHRDDKMLTNPYKWNKYISTLYAYDQIFMLGSYYNNRMVGYIVAYELEDKINILHAYIDRKDAEITSPMNGLIFNLINLLIKKYGTVTISYGIESFAPLPELNRFKCNMLFKRIPVTRLYLINPLLIPWIKVYLFVILNLLHKKNVHNPFTRKLIRLYQGHRLYYKVLKRQKLMSLMA